MIKGKIYKIISDSTDKIYIGSTVQKLSQRLGEHKYKYKKYIDGKYAHNSSFEILKYGDAKILLIKEVELNTKEEIKAIEGEYIKKYMSNGGCVNNRIAGRDRKQRRKDNKKICNICLKIYDYDFLDTHKKNVHTNREDAQNKRREKYIKQNIDKYECKVCQTIIKKTSIYSHNKTAKHNQNLL